MELVAFWNYVFLSLNNQLFPSVSLFCSFPSEFLQYFCFLDLNFLILLLPHGFS